MLIREHRSSLSAQPGVRGDERTYEWAEDTFVSWDAEADPEPGKGVIVGLKHLLGEAEVLLVSNHPLGVLVEPGEAVEALEPYLDRLALMALSFPKYRDGRPYSSAALLRERSGYTGELRAVGDVLREQAWAMARVGFDSFAPVDGSTPADWTTAVNRYRHVYQRAEDDRAPIFRERVHG